MPSGHAALALVVASADLAAAQRVRSGVLTCDISAGISFIIGSQKSVICTWFQQHDRVAAGFGVHFGRTQFGPRRGGAASAPRPLTAASSARCTNGRRRGGRFRRHATNACPYEFRRRAPDAGASCQVPLRPETIAQTVSQKTAPRWIGRRIWHRTAQELRVHGASRWWARSRAARRRYSRQSLPAPALSSAKARWTQRTPSATPARRRAITR